MRQALHRVLLANPIMGLPNRLGRHCVGVMNIPPLTEGQICVGPDDVFTWKAANSQFVSLIQYAPSKTAVYLHKSDMHYCAKEAAALGPNCPVNTVLLGQVCFSFPRF